MHSNVDICWDKNGKITSINYVYNDMNTGTAATGLYMIMTTSGTIVINVKSGKLSTSAAKFTSFGQSFTLTFDPVMGCTVLN